MFHPTTAPVETLLTPDVPIRRRDARRSRARTRARRRLRRAVLYTLGAGAMALGAATLGLSLFAPHLVERGYGEARAAANEAALLLAPPATANGERMPSVRLGDLGSEALMDACDGSFPQLESYAAQDGLQPVYAAHNGCGGDVILPWSVGERVEVVAADGSASVYVVSDFRDVAKFGSSTRDVLGLTGSLLLQTCHWGDPQMRFVALTAA